MSKSLANPPQAPRRSSRRPKKDPIPTTPQINSFHPENPLPTLPVKTSPSTSPPTGSKNGKNHASAARKKALGPKKQTNGSESSQSTSQGQTVSQSNLLSPNKKATPLKQAYAGPTFHASPAASSLPMPSFYSKSLPAVTAGTSLSSNTQLDGQGPPEPDMESIMPNRSEDAATKAREPSPLDFMFEAARKARESPKTQSPDIRAARLSPFDETPRNGSRTPGDSSSESVFPFELDSNGGRALSIGPSFATPYKDRMDALRSPRAHSMTPLLDLDEKERREKSEALKRLLINASPLRSPQNPDMKSYFPDLGVQTQPASPHVQRRRQKSGPPISQSGFQHAPVAQNHLQSIPTTVQERNSPVQQRPISSHLRREYQPHHHQAPAELVSDSSTPPRISPALQTNRQSIANPTMNNCGRQSHYPDTTTKIQTRSAYSAQKLEDDLRRVLNLDLTSNS